MGNEGYCRAIGVGNSAPSTKDLVSYMTSCLGDYLGYWRDSRRTEVEAVLHSKRACAREE